FGGTLTIDGVPINATNEADRTGSCMIVIATDAPLDGRQLERLARRAFPGMARTGASFSHGSGDYATAFATALDVRIPHAAPSLRPARTYDEAHLSTLFSAVADATEEAIVNSLLASPTMTGRAGHTAEGLPVERVRALLSRRQ